MAPRKTASARVLKSTNPAPQPPATPPEDSAPLASTRAEAKSRHLSLQKLAAFLNRDRNTVQKYIDQGMPVVERADRDRGISWVIDSADAVRWLEERSATKVAEKIGDVRGMSEDEAKAQTAVYKMISSSVAAAEDIRMVAKVQDMLDLMRQDYVELLLRLGAVPDTIAGKVDAKISAKVRAVAEEQIQSALKALVAVSEAEKRLKG
jgi:terminase small subunit / prophage DNA-packing protein